MSSQSSVNSSSFNSVKSISMQALDKTDQVLTRSLGFLSNSYIYNIVLILLILYAPVAAPMIGNSLAGLFGNYAVKFVYVFLLAYLLSKSVKVALLTSVVIVVGIFILKKFNYSEHLDASDIMSEGVNVKKVEEDSQYSQDSSSEQELSNYEGSKKVEIVSAPAYVVPTQEEILSTQDNVSGPVAADITNQILADATYENTLPPPVKKVNLEESVKSSPEDIINVCGSRLSADGYTGFDEAKANYSPL